MCLLKHLRGPSVEKKKIYIHKEFTIELFTTIWFTNHMHFVFLEKVKVNTVFKFQPNALFLEKV